MSEQQPPQPPTGERPTPSPWRADEQVGDIYRTEINHETGQVEQAEIIQPNASAAEPTSEANPNERPHIWVGSWSDYNNGVLHGRWIDAARQEAELWADIEAMLADSPTAKRYGEPAEEWGIFDHENFHGLRIGEQESIAYVSKLARGIAEHGPAFAAYADVVEEQSALDGFSEDYAGHFDSVEAFAEEYADGLSFELMLDSWVPQYVRKYARIDYQLLATDLVAGGDYHAVPADDGGVWIFNGH